MDILSTAAVVLSAAGLVSVLARLFRLRLAERELVDTLEKQEKIATALEKTRGSLEGRRPEPEAVANARALVDIASKDLSNRTKRDIQRFVAQGSEKSQANYLTKLIDVLELERTESDEEAGGAESSEEVEVERAG